MPDKQATAKKPYCPPRLYRLTATDVVRKAIRIAKAQDLERAQQTEEGASAVEEGHAIPPREGG